MSQSTMLKEDILKILSKSVKGGSNTRPTYQSAKQPTTFFGGENQPYYPLAQEPNPAANPMKPIVPSIISKKNPSKRPTYKSSKQPLTFFGGETECAKAKKLVKEKCGKKKRAPSAYNLFIKKYFAENSNASMKSAAAAWKLSKPSTKAAPKDRPKIAITSFGDVPPPPDTPPPKKKTQTIIPKKKKSQKPPPPPTTTPPKKKKKKAADKDGVEVSDSEDDFEFDINTPAARRTSTFRPTPTKPRSLADELKVVDDPQALLDSSVDQYGIDDDEPAPKKIPAPKKKAAPKKIPAAAIAKAKTELEKRTGLTKAEANKLSPTELFGMLPPEIRRMILDPKITGVKVGNRVLLKDFDMRNESEYYETKDFIGNNIDESLGYYDNYGEYLSKRDAAFFKDNVYNTDELSRKELNRYETIQEKLRDNIQKEVDKTMNKLYKDWKKTTGNKETDTEDNWLMRFMIFVDKAGYDIVYGSDTKEYYVKKRKAAAREEKEEIERLARVAARAKAAKAKALEEEARERADRDGIDEYELVEHNGKEYVIFNGKVYLLEDGDTIDMDRPITEEEELIKIIKSKANSGGNIRNTGKSRPKLQLKSASGKANSTKKNTSWLSHVAEFRKANPSIKNRDVMREAKKTYNKSGGELLLTNSGGAELVVDNNKIETHKMPDGSVMSGKTHSKLSELVKQKKAGNVPEAPDKQDKKSDDDQSKIMVDIMNSFDVFNDRFGAISNSAGTIEEKKTQYKNERAKLEKYHEDIIKNYKDSLSSSNMEIATKAYNYAAETYKIGVDNLTAGVPTQRVDFENFDDNDTITEIIDKQLARPRTALDRAKSFYSVPLPEAKIQNFNPKVPSLGNMASIYPYGRQQAEKILMGGRVKKDPKKLITELTKDLFIRDMTKIYPRRSLKEIKSAYKKYKKDIESIMTDAIIDSMKIRGGADCAANQYSSGDRCYNKQPRPDNFDRTKFDAEQKRQAASNQRRDDGMVKMPDPIATAKLDTSTRSFANPANPMPSPKPQPKNEKDFVSKFSAAITPPDSGAIFGTDGSDITDPRAWIDTIYNIAMGTAKGVESIFSALGEIF